MDFLKRHLTPKNVENLISNYLFSRSKYALKAQEQLSNFRIFQEFEILKTCMSDEQ